MILNALFRGRADGCNLQMLERIDTQAERLEPRKHRFHSVHAGEDQPVVLKDALKCGVERII